MHLATDVLVIGSGGAGMYAAVAAARAGARVLLVDKSLIGRGGATIMAQMTVASAVGEEAPDHWTHHLADTLEAGRGLCDGRLAAILCEESPLRIREMDDWKVGWAREDGHIKQVTAPGHQVPRCVYVDFLNTGPAVAKTLRAQVARGDGITRVSDLSITDLVVHDGRVAGAVGFALEDGSPVTVAAKAVILAAGGLTKIYQRNSASTNMGGDAFALALHAGADLVDMEFVQFFPIGHLAPRLVGMDPIMWDPFRYKLGGRLLNGNQEEFIENYGATDSGTYTAPRDVASYAIMKEAEAGRGSPNGGAFLSFQHVPEPELRAAFGPVIDRLLANDIDLTERSVEVAPIAHYHMGGVRVDEMMRTTVPGLYAAGEAVGGGERREPPIGECDSGSAGLRRTGRPVCCRGSKRVEPTLVRRRRGIGARPVAWFRRWEPGQCQRCGRGTAGRITEFDVGESRALAYAGWVVRRARLFAADAAGRFAGDRGPNGCPLRACDSRLVRIAGVASGGGNRCAGGPAPL